MTPPTSPAFRELIRTAFNAGAVAGSEISQDLLESLSQKLLSGWPDLNAAPELLEALRGITYWASRVYKKHVSKDKYTQKLIKRLYLDKARAIIAKAEAPK